MSRRLRWLALGIIPPLARVQSQTYLSYLPKELIDLLWEYYPARSNVVRDNRWIYVDKYMLYVSPNIARRDSMSRLIQQSWDAPQKTLLHERMYITFDRGEMETERIANHYTVRMTLSLELVEALVAIDQLPRILED